MLPYYSIQPCIHNNPNSLSTKQSTHNIRIKKKRTLERRSYFWVLNRLYDEFLHRYSDKCKLVKRFRPHSIWVGTTNYVEQGTHICCVLCSIQMDIKKDKYSYTRIYFRKYLSIPFCSVLASRYRKETMIRASRFVFIESVRAYSPRYVL